MDDWGEYFFSVLLYTSIYLVHLALPALVVYLLGRKWIRPWFSRGRWRWAAVLGGIFAIVFGYTAWSQVYSPWIGYDHVVARYWMRKAAEAPTREEKERHVWRVVDSVKGGYITARAISRLPDRKDRCELLEIGTRTPNASQTSSLEEDLKKECRD